MDFFLLFLKMFDPAFTTMRTAQLLRTPAHQSQFCNVTTIHRVAICFSGNFQHQIPRVSNSKMQSRVDQRAVIKFQDKTPIQCWRELQAVYGNVALGKMQVQHWHKVYRNGDLQTSTTDKKRSRHLRSICTEENIGLIHDLVEADRRKTVRELVAESGLSQGSVHRILCKDLNFSHICAKFVPRLLTLEQKKHQSKLSMDNLSLLDNGGCFFMEQIVSGDETWLYCFDPETKTRSSQ